MVALNNYGFTTIYKTANVAFSNAQQMLNDLTTLKCSRCRFQIPWGGGANPIEYQAPSGPTYFYNWQALDDIVKRCNQSGIWLDFNIFSPPSWHTALYTVGSDTHNWAIPADMAKFATDIVNRYNTPISQGGLGIIDCLGIGNEDADVFGAPQDIRDYGGVLAGQWLAAVGAAVTPIQPSMVYESAAMIQQNNPGGHIQTWLNNLISQAGANTYFQNVNFHFYKGNNGPPEGNGYEFSQFCTDILAAKVALSLNLPTWCTEFGWDMNGNTINLPPPNYPAASTVWTYIQQILNENKVNQWCTVMMPYTLGKNETKSWTLHGPIDGQQEYFQQPLFNNLPLWIEANGVVTVPNISITNGVQILDQYGNPIYTNNPLPVQLENASIPTEPVASSTSAITTVGASLTDVQLLAANTSRKGYRVFNASSATMFLAEAGSVSSSTETIEVPPNWYWEPNNGSFIWQGAVHALWSVANGNAIITEYT